MSDGQQPVAILSWEQADQIMQDQRAEISRLRLTDAEREAVEAAIESCEHGADFNDQRIYPATAQRLRERAATLRGLLDRLGGGR